MRGGLQVVAKGGDLLLNHDAKDVQHGNTVVFEFDEIHGELDLSIKVTLVPAKVDAPIAEVSHRLIGGFFHIKLEM